MAYNSKFTGAQIDALLDASEAMKTSKEDVANKVTSLDADATDAQYPSAKAVKDALAKVKNIEVNPDMLSESTKQFINASGGGTITNFPDDEDLTTVDNALKLADKTYDPITYSGMGRKYLRKNLVDGKNILTQAILPSANTIYIIQYDYDLNGATINVPSGCVLDFQGGSLRNGTLNLNYCKINGIGLKVNILNAKNYGYKLSSYLADVSDKDLNTSVVNELIAEGIPIIVDYHDIYFSGELDVQSNPIFIETCGNNNANFYFTETENQRGIVFSKSFRMHRIHRLNIWANGYGMDMSNAGLYRSDFIDMEIKSYNSHAVYGGDNVTPGGGTKTFDLKFERVHVQAPNGCGMWGLNGNTGKFYEVSSSNIGDSLFYNCSGTFLSCNNQYYQTTGKTFYKLRTREDGTYGRYKSVFLSCNIEDYQGPIVDCEGKIYVHLTFINCVFYTHTIDGVVQESPIKILSGLRDLTFLNCGNLGDNVEAGIGAIQISENLSECMPLISNRSTYTYTVSDTYGNMITLENFDKKVDSNVTYKLPKVLYTTAPNIKTGIVRATDLVINNTKSIVFDNTNSTQQILSFQKFIADGLIVINFADESKTYCYMNYFDMYNTPMTKKCSFYIKNDSPNTQIIFRPREIKENRLVGVVTPTGVAWTLEAGEVACCEFIPATLYTNAFVRILGKMNEFTLNTRGTTELRPTTPHISFQYFDTTLGKPIWWNGSAWVDSTGAVV